MALVKRETDATEFDFENQNNIKENINEVVILLGEVIKNNELILEYLEDENTWSGLAQKEFLALFDIVQQYCIDLEPVYDEHAKSWQTYDEVYESLLSSNLIGGLNDE